MSRSPSPSPRSPPAGASPRAKSMRKFRTSSHWRADPGPLRRHRSVRGTSMGRPVSTPPTTGSSSAEVVSMSTGGRTGNTSAFQRGGESARSGTLPRPAHRRPEFADHIRGPGRLPGRQRALRLGARDLGAQRQAAETSSRGSAARSHDTRAGRREAEGHEVGPKHARRKKPVQDGTILRELLMLRAAIRWASKEKWPVTGTAGADLGSRGSCRRLIDLGWIAGGKKRAEVPINDELRPVLEEARQAAPAPLRWSSPAAGSGM